MYVPKQTYGILVKFYVKRSCKTILQANLFFWVKRFMEHGKYQCTFSLHKLLASIDAKILFATHVKHPEKLV